MPVQIDRMDTAIEITPPTPTAAATPAGERHSSAMPNLALQSSLRDTIGALMARELDLFLRNRGM